MPATYDFVPTARGEPIVIAVQADFITGNLAVPCAAIAPGPAPPVGAAIVFDRFAADDGHSPGRPPAPCA